MQIKYGTFFCCLLCCLGMLSLQATEADRIVSFHSDISIAINGEVMVMETIKVYNGSGGENDLIQRGIVRTFPTTYTTKEGLRSSVPFEIIEVKKNGITESYHSKKVTNGIELYLGSSHVYLENGIYSYEISYQTGKQIIFHKEKDEFYWNVNGNGWQFTADAVSCTVTFPDGATVKEQQCYTGVMGSTEQICNSKRIADNVIAFQTADALNQFEGLTIAAAIQKGVLQEPSSLEKYISMLKDNWIIPALVLFLLFMFIINLRYWFKHGKDPEGGVIYPQFSPPADMSPADVGYLIRQSFTADLFTASIVDYAVHKRVDIAVTQEGMLIKSPVYTFNKPASVSGKYERDYTRYEWYGYDIETLFGRQAKKGSYNAVLAKCFDSLSAQLKKRMLIREGNKNTFKGLFKLNDGFIALGSFFIVVMIVATIVYLAKFPNLILIIAAIILLVISIIIHVLFSKIMSAYTVEGRRIADQVLGFKMYLETTEQHVFDELNPPEMTIQLFEAYLPYAIALNCENKWSEKFEAVINAAIQGGYQPAYYSASGMSFSTSTFTHSLSSGLSSTISSASTPPSSSSGGSSGGGSSGGGGGGGGGGGW